MDFPSAEQVFPTSMPLLKVELTTPIRCQTLAWRSMGGHMDWYPKKENITAAQYYHRKGMQAHLDYVLSLYTPQEGARSSENFGIVNVLFYRIIQNFSNIVYCRT